LASFEANASPSSSIERGRFELVAGTRSALRFHGRRSDLTLNDQPVQNIQIFGKLKQEPMKNWGGKRDGDKSVARLAGMCYTKSYLE
jgi:hypothetical protein